jgi:hypothetical protein
MFPAATALDPVGEFGVKGFERADSGPKLRSRLSTRQI